MTLGMPSPIKSEVLYFFYADGCHACAKAKPEWQKFKDRNPRIMAVELDALGTTADNLGVEIRATPSYLLKRGSEGELKAGILTCKQLESWLKAGDE
jgi:thiol-disulfide isomerase/thioredoxin